MTALLLAGLLAAQPPAAPKGPPPPELEAVRPFAVLFGEHDTVTTEYGPDGKAAKSTKGYERIFVKGQIAVVCDRGAEDGYDDLMVYQYDQDAKAVKGFLFMPLPKPRVIDVAVKDGVFTLTYPPLVLDGKTFTTRETITPQRGGAYLRKVEHKQPDGTYKLVRTIQGGPPKAEPKQPGGGR